MKFWIKIHGPVLAVCDEEVLGCVFEDGDIYFEVKESFYKGELVDKQQLIKLLMNMRNINIIGNNAVSIADSLGMVSKTINISGVKHAIIVKIKGDVYE